MASILGLGLHEGAYAAELFRAGIVSVPSGQVDAALSVGFSRRAALRRVVLPQTIRVVIPPIGNQFIGMLKLSALISVIGVRDLLLAAEQSASATFRYLEALSAAAVYYLAFTTVLMALQRALERKLGRSRRLVTGLTADG